jgi:hypothetical protein
MRLLGERQTEDRKAINAALAKRVRYAGAKQIHDFQVSNESQP